ncbi:nuclear transport factor 2 family protein [Nonomuraea sp. NPDC052265]|uniref:nuclear transport factor 2 family protein n=1 Tax=Nonomuraea sp. NPDC052265 TaxID=3364374 RepID=UPI0037C8A51A
MHPIGTQALSAFDTAAIVGELKDRQEVIDALHRFGLGLDPQDRELLASALAADAGLDYRSVAAMWGADHPLMVGRHTIVNLLLSTFAGRVDTTHTVTNPRAQVDGDTARLAALVQVHHLLKVDRDQHALLTNRYTVDLTREGAHWVMHRIHIDTAWYTGDPAAIFSRWKRPPAVNEAVFVARLLPTPRFG